MSPTIAACCLFSRPLIATTENAYHGGVDFRFLPKTTLSYDQFLAYDKQDNVTADNESDFLLPGSVPVDLGIVWNTAGSTPVRNSVPGDHAGSCEVQPAMESCPTRESAGRAIFMPTERFSFQSTYFKNLEMSGSAGYSTSNNQIPDFNEILTGSHHSNRHAGKHQQRPGRGQARFRECGLVGIYSVTEKFRIEDAFRYDNWRIPGVWDAVEGNQFSSLGRGLSVDAAANRVSLLRRPSTRFARPRTQRRPARSTLPGSGPDIETEINSKFPWTEPEAEHVSASIRFLEAFQRAHRVSLHEPKNRRLRLVSRHGRNLFPRRPHRHRGELIISRRAATAPSRHPRRRTVFPSKCTLQSNGSIIAIGLDAGSDTARNIIDINEHAALIGFTARPIDSLRITGDFEFGYNDFSFTRTSPRQLQSYKIHANYTPRPWLNLDGAIDIHENRDNVYQVNNLEHGRTYSFVTVFSPNPKYSFDLGYNYTDIYSQALVCFAASGTGVPAYPACPIAGSPVTLSAMSFYSSNQHFAYFDVMWKPIKRVRRTWVMRERLSAEIRSS